MTQRSFTYAATTAAGEKLSGTVDAADADAARRQLEALALRIETIGETPSTSRARPLRGQEFLAFNQQLAQLTRAGLPIEQGLRLIAEDLGSGRMAEATRQIAEDLERGQPLAEAFERRRTTFP